MWQPDCMKTQESAVQKDGGRHCRSVLQVAMLRRVAQRPEVKAAAIV
jgi:hypothetical protein